MAAPRLNVRLALELPDRVEDGMGGHGVAWRSVGWLWARMEARSGRSRPGELAPHGVVQWRIVVRGAPAGDPRRPRAGQRFRMGQRMFRIEAVAERDSRGLYLDCFAREEETA